MSELNCVQKPILFVDFDGTICHDRYWRSLPEELHQKVQELLFGNDTSMVHDWMHGQYTAEEVNQFVADKIEVNFDDLWHIFVSDCKTMKVPVTVLETIKTLSDRYTTILVTGNMDSFSRFTVPELSLEDYFDEISNSFYERIHKTDNNGEIFKKFTNKYEVEFNECVLLDDSDRVCQIFAELGGEPMQVTTDDSVENHLETLLST